VIVGVIRVARTSERDCESWDQHRAQPDMRPRQVGRSVDRRLGCLVGGTQLPPKTRHDAQLITPKGEPQIECDNDAKADFGGSQLLGTKVGQTCVAFGVQGQRRR
jgi:hypothetical protein